MSLAKPRLYFRTGPASGAAVSGSAPSGGARANRFMPSVDRLVPLRLLCRLPFLFQLLLSLVAVIAQLKAAAQDLPVSLFLEGASTTPQAEAERSPFSRARLLQVDPRATASLLSLTPDQPARILLNLF